MRAGAVRLDVVTVDLFSSTKTEMYALTSR